VISKSAPRTPIAQAVRSTVIMTVFGFAVRYIGGALDPDFRTWSYVFLAPIMGGLSYLFASGRASIVAAVLFGLGVGGLVFWSALLWTDRFPITGRMDWVFIAFILSIPVLCLGMAIRIWRRVRIAPVGAP
jgi:uncharacterized membrane protein